MRKTIAILGKELQAYFVSPIAYAVMTVFLFLSGFFSKRCFRAVRSTQWRRRRFLRTMVSRFWGFPRAYRVKAGCWLVKKQHLG